MDNHDVYLIACCSETTVYVKIGLTSSIQRRLSNVQTGCPHVITDAFIILSEYREEVEGLEKLLHIILAPQCLRAEWYVGTNDFFLVLEAVLGRVNAGGFSYEEIEELPDFTGPELEIMMHGHDFEFRRVSLPLRSGREVRVESAPVTPTKIAEILRQART